MLCVIIWVYFYYINLPKPPQNSYKWLLDSLKNSKIHNSYSNYDIVFANKNVYNIKDVNWDLLHNIATKANNPKFMNPFIKNDQKIFFENFINNEQNIYEKNTYNLKLILITISCLYFISCVSINSLKYI